MSIEELALCAASKHGLTPELIDVLENYDININVQDGAGNTPLMLAAMNGHIDCVIVLLRHGANMNLRNAHRETALMHAIYNDSEFKINIIKLLIISGASIHAVNNRHENPMMLACQRGSLELVKLFVHFNATTTITDIFDNTLLHHACINGNYHLIEYLLTLDIPIDKHNKFMESPLSLAVENGHNKTIKLLLSNYAIDTTYSKNGNTLLHEAVQMGTRDANRLDIAKAFINHSQHIDMTNHKGKTALMIACENSALCLVEAILEKYPNTSIQDLEGNTCLSYALENRDEDIALALISYEPSILEVMNNSGEDVFMQACRSTKTIVKLIYETFLGTVDLKNTNADGNTALHISILADRLEIAKYLLTLDCYPRMVNKYGDNAINIAMSKFWQTDQNNIMKELRRFFLKERVALSINISTDICAICITDADDVMMECGHVFHITCMLQYIDYLESNAKCPLCRRDILS